MAYQTGLDVDGSLTGTKGAKYIEFGKVEEDLVGLVQKPCTGDPGPTPGQKDVRGSQSSPLLLPVGRVTGVLYEASAILTAGDGSTPGQVQVFVKEGIPGPDGTIEGGEPTSGAIIRFGEVGSSEAPVTLSEIAPGFGVYTAPADAQITPGKLYSVSIDGDGNGSIDGTGSAFALGKVEWTNPKDGDTVSSADFTASWSDSGSQLGGAGYAAMYQAVISGSDGSGDTAIYVGSEREFLVKSLVSPDAAGLKPGSYTGTLLGFSGALGGGGVSISNNITGVGVTGVFSSISGSSTPITFTVE